MTPVTASVQTRSPLQNPLFRMLWIASMVSNIGTWVQNTGGSWLMTNLTTSSTLIALMQTATTLPVLFAALPAGTLADFFNKRSLLIGSVIFQIIVGITLTALTYYNLVNTSVLLLFTFLIGLGNASFNPVWQSLTPEIVGRDALPSAVALNGALTNVSRSVGPAIGGFLVAQAGYYAVFAANALSSVYMLIVLLRWRNDTTIENKPSTGNVWSALGAGIRYARYSEPLRGVLAHALLFVSFASCIWALLPLIARQQLHFQASGYGSLLGMMGAGSITGVFLLSRLRQRFNLDTLLLAGGLGFACILAMIGFLPQAYLVMPLLYGAGFCWLIVLTSLNISAQYSAPSWVKARVLAIYLLVFQGGMAIFSFLWGALNQLLPLSYTLATAGVGLVGGSLLAYRYKLHPISEINHQPALAWPDPEVIVDLQPSDGPVLVTIDYSVDPQNQTDFLLIMQQIGQTRLRDGALEWDVYQDLSNPTHFFETFQVGSWAEHLQQHQHLSQHDYQIQQRIKPLINGQPVVHHLIHQAAPER